MTVPLGSISTSLMETSSTAGGSTGMAGLVQPNTFLNLLVDEMKYQDPLNPTSSSNFMAQLAQLSQVEQLTSVSSSLAVSEAASLIGKNVTGMDASGNTISGTVSSVTNGSNGPVLDVNGSSVSLSSVTKIGS